MSESDQALLDAFRALEVAIAEMNTWWIQRVLRASVYSLPVLGERSVPDVLDVEVHRGEQAIEAAVKAYARFQLFDYQDAGTAFRLPGWIVVDDSLEPVERVNRLKDELRSAIRAEAERSVDRERLCRRLFPRCSMNQVYRRIVTAEERHEALRFTWSPSTVSTTRLSPESVHANLEKRRRLAETAGQGAWVAALDIALRRVASLPSSAIVLRRRPVAPHPRASLFKTRGRGAQKAMVHANLPIILSRACMDISVSDLRGFDRSRRRRQRSDKRVLEPILEGLYLYVERTQTAETTESHDNG